MDRNSFVFYIDWFEVLNELPDDDRLKAYDAIVNYAFNGEKTDDKYIGAVIALMLKTIDRNNDKWEEIKEKRREAGRKGGLQRVANQANQANACNTKQNQANQANQAVNVNVNGNVNENGTSKEVKEKKDKDKSLSKKNKFIKPSVDDVYAYILEKGYNVDAEHFVSYYESNGWKVGRNQMKDWRAAVRTWAKNNITLNNNHNNGNNYISRDAQRRAEKAERDAEADALVRHLIATSQPAEETEVGAVPYKQLASHSVSGGGKP